MTQIKLKVDAKKCDYPSSTKIKSFLSEPTIAWKKIHLTFSKL